MRVDCKCQAKSNVHLIESQIKTVKARTKPKLWTGVPLIEVSMERGAFWKENIEDRVNLLGPSNV